MFNACWRGTLLLGGASCLRDGLRRRGAGGDNAPLQHSLEEERMAGRGRRGMAGRASGAQAAGRRKAPSQTAGTWRSLRQQSWWFWFSVCVNIGSYLSPLPATAIAGRWRAYRARRTPHTFPNAYYRRRRAAGGWAVRYERSTTMAFRGCRHLWRYIRRAGMTGQAARAFWDGRAGRRWAITSRTPRAPPQPAGHQRAQREHLFTLVTT